MPEEAKNDDAHERKTGVFERQDRTPLGSPKRPSGLDSLGAEARQYHGAQETGNVALRPGHAFPGADLSSPASAPSKAFSDSIEAPKAGAKEKSISRGVKVAASILGFSLFAKTMAATGGTGLLISAGVGAGVGLAAAAYAAHKREKAAVSNQKALGELPQTFSNGQKVEKQAKYSLSHVFAQTFKMYHETAKSNPIKKLLGSKEQKGKISAAFGYATSFATLGLVTATTLVEQARGYDREAKAVNEHVQNANPAARTVNEHAQNVNPAEMQQSYRGGPSEAVSPRGSKLNDGVASGTNRQGVEELPRSQSSNNSSVDLFRAAGARSSDSQEVDARVQDIILRAQEEVKRAIVATKELSIKENTKEGVKELGIKENTKEGVKEHSSSPKKKSTDSRFEAMLSEGHKRRTSSVYGAATQQPQPGRSR